MKPHRKAQRIPSEAWQAVEKAVCAGMGYTEAARRFGIRSPHTIMMRARRNRWPVPSRVKERILALQLSVTRRAEAGEQRRKCNEQTTEAIAESWVEKGETHRRLAFDMAHTSLRKAAKAPLMPQKWQDSSSSNSACPITLRNVV